MTEAANVYVSYGSTVTPPGTANFTLSAQPNNQNNPNVKPQESRNYEIGGKMGFYENRLSFSAAAFRTDNENVISPWTPQRFRRSTTRMTASGSTA